MLVYQRVYVSLVSRSTRTKCEFYVLGRLGNYWLQNVEDLTFTSHYQSLNGVKDFSIFNDFQLKKIPSLKLTWPLKSYLPNRKVVFQPSIFRGELLVSGRVVSFPGCNKDGYVHLPGCTTLSEAGIRNNEIGVAWNERLEGLGLEFRPLGSQFKNPMEKHNF